MSISMYHTEGRPMHKWKDRVQTMVDKGGGRLNGE